MEEGTGIAFVWDNFGPLHIDRCAAVARHSSGKYRVVGIEIFARSDLYDWENPSPDGFDKQTLFESGSWHDQGARMIARRIVAAVTDAGCGAAFLCHYDTPAIMLASRALRRAGVRVFTMGCSKLDDAPRKAWREWIKRRVLSVYEGALGSEQRSTAYFRSLGFPADRVAGGYNTVDQARIRTLAESESALVPFAGRALLIVARLIPEKNYPMLFRAYASYCECTKQPRRLAIAGSGPLEGELRQLADALGIAQQLDWHGFALSGEVARLMRDALCLLLPSRSETFGNVVAEALALDLPVIASAQCGAAGFLVRDGENGRVVDHRDARSLAEAMIEAGSDEARWLDWRAASGRLAPLGDVARFAEGVERLVSPS